MSGFSPAQRRVLFARDVYCIPHAGMCAGPLVLHHRRNRGAGGDPTADVVSNGLVVCHGWNTIVEQNAAAADEARRNGWKLRSWQDAAEVPVHLPEIGHAVHLDDEGNYRDEANRLVTFLRV